MSERVTVVLNQQQRELLDETVERFPGKSREEVLLQALREFCAEQGTSTGPGR
ncbi:MAG: ribbon-helix-helix domain-containing protein [Nocardiopsaceae bacterium]|jgi:Arc/MetJ-type ribon-helix-helix transcriptional regulator|nr:ribbon-helix-helix domain-containing protein [Nocardiopsaceae bacterium]